MSPGPDKVVLPQRVLVVGAGLLGSAFATERLELGDDVLLLSRHPIDSALPWHSFDATASESWHRIASVFAPDIVVLVHGPSDVTLCEVDPHISTAAHRQATELACSYFPNAWKLLISTDNVFPGSAPVSFEDDVVDPCNAYGLAKRAAEQVALEHHNVLVLRVSVVYGWETSGKPGRAPNYFVRVIDALRSGRRVDAPTDHWNTPVLLNDFVAICSEAAQKRSTGVLNVGGPERLSRSHWASIIAQESGLDAGLINALSKCETTYACRPENGGLDSRRRFEFASFDSMAGVRAGTRRLLAAPPIPKANAPAGELPGSQTGVR